MPARKPRPYAWTPWTMTWAEVAASVFRRQESWLRDHLKDYPGFPPPDRQLDLFWRKAVERWADARAGIVAPDAGPQDVEAILIERTNAGRSRAVSGPASS